MLPPICEGWSRRGMPLAQVYLWAEAIPPGLVWSVLCCGQTVWDASQCLGPLSVLPGWPGRLTYFSARLC